MGLARVVGHGSHPIMWNLVGTLTSIRFFSTPQGASFVQVSIKPLFDADTEGVLAVTRFMTDNTGLSFPSRLHRSPLLPIYLQTLVRPPPRACGLATTCPLSVPPRYYNRPLPTSHHYPQTTDARDGQAKFIDRLAE